MGLGGFGELENWERGRRREKGTGKGRISVSAFSPSPNLPVPLPYGTIFENGSLHGPWPFGPLARTRTQMRCPLVSPVRCHVEVVGEIMSTYGPATESTVVTSTSKF